jgi:glycosyltransferase involved in cell wall biosynthesis
VRIAIDARAAAEVAAGRGRHVRELLRALARRTDPHEYLLLARRPWAEPALDERFRWRTLRAPDPAWALAAAAAASRTADVLLATNSYLLAAVARVPAVAVVHDLVAFDPATRPPTGSLAERLTLPPAVRRARALVCVSAATQELLEARFPRARGRTVVVHHGVDDAFARAAQDPAAVAARYGVTQRYVLMTGTLEPRKNVPRAIEAFAGLPHQIRRDRKLVLVGSRGWDLAQLDSALRRHADVVHVLGRVPDHDLPALLAGADVFCYPSLQEGFGLPVLEAMAAGTAVVTSSVSSMPEVAGDAALCVDPLDVDAIRAAMAKLLSDQAVRDDFGRRGRERAATFTWDRTARETLAVIASAAAT